MRTFSSLLVVILFATVAQGQSPERDEEELTPGCGVERWAVKVLNDSGVHRVDTTPVNRTVVQLIASPVVVPAFAEPRRNDETTTYNVVCYLKAYKLENDLDVHLVIEDTAQRSSTMIVEIPDSSCPDAVASGFASSYAAARRALIAIAHGQEPDTVLRFFPSRTLAVVKGVGFYDPPHNQFGKAPNNLELHPVLGIKAGAPSAIASPYGAIPVESALEIFPQPVRRRAHVRFSSPISGGATVTVVNMLGQRVRSFDMLQFGTRKDIIEDFSGLPAGVYTILVRTIHNTINRAVMRVEY